MGSDAIFLLDETGYVDCNGEAERMFGATRDYIIHKKPGDLSPETQPDGSNSRDLALERVRTAWAGNQPAFDWKHKRSDGTLFDAEVSLDRVDIAGRPLLLAIVRDVTERRRIEEASRETEQMFRAIVENSHAGIFTIDDSFRVTYANDMTGKMLLRTNEEIIGRDFRDLLDEESVKIVGDRYMRRRMGEEVPSRYEFNIVQKDGNKRRVEISSTIFRTTSGNLRTVGQVLDITEHKKADEELRLAHEELESRVEKRTAELREANVHLQSAIAQRVLAEDAMRQSEIKYRHLVENANTIILEMDAEGKVTFINRFAEEFFGFDESEMLGHSIVGTIVPAGPEAQRNFQALIDDIVKHPDHYTQNEYEFVKKSGEPVWIVWTNRPIFDEQGRLQRILRVGIDRTEQRRSEHALARQASEQAAAAERNRLARDLHDAVSQTLFSASLIAEVLPRLWERDEAEGRRRLEEVRQLTRGALAEMRTLLLELRPSSLMEAELGYLLKQLGESITGRSRVPVEVSVRGECPPLPDVKVAVYRIAQESLNNIAKHSGATKAEVSLICEPDKVILQVSDNGRGFDATAAHTDSLGLGIMRERARQIGASLSIRSKAGKGTSIRVMWKGT
ncbi:MAG: hypothetical protein A2147_07315 [Chloroflexi bacterium RBG_16_57_8]|nr:MAG: hypothetical protein A2147_07315 [Chloroflexi bacterium RBG_16_57_8]